MKKRLPIITILFLLIFLIFMQPHAGDLNANQEEDIFRLDEENMIKKAVEDQYIKGIKIRDFELIKEICIPEARLMSADRNGEFHLTTLEKWSRRFDPSNPPFENLDACIVKIDREGSAAQVKILFIVDKKQKVIDFLHMLKLDGEWRIVNIIDY